MREASPRKKVQLSSGSTNDQAICFGHNPFSKGNQHWHEMAPAGLILELSTVNEGCSRGPAAASLSKKPGEKDLIVLNQKVARFEFENQLFEKIQNWRARC